MVKYERHMVGKNVCHTVVFNKERYDQLVTNINPASTLFKDGMEIYLNKHLEKKFHDPLAAVCHLHPEIGTWFRGSTIRLKGKWTTVANPNGDYILADVDRESFWNRITSFS